MGSSVLHRNAYRRFRRLLRQWRLDAGLSQRAMGDRLGRPASFVHKCEAGERRIDPLEFVEWCRACGINPAKVINQLDA